MKTTISLGKIDYNNTGRKINEVTIDIEIKICEGECKKDISGNPVIGTYSVLSICGDIWNNRKTDICCGGQIGDEIEEIFKTNNNVQRLVKIWKRWHLNDVRNGYSEWLLEYLPENIETELNDMVSNFKVI